MKRILLMTAALIFSIGIYAQNKTINDNIKQQYLGIDTASSKIVYCEIVGIQKFMSKKVVISIDFGQEQTYFSDNRLVDESGKPVVFNSMVDAINFMSKRGWELHSTMLVGQNNQYTYHFVMQKKIKLE